MNEERFFKRLINQISAFWRGEKPKAKPETNGVMLRQMLQMIEQTDEVELPCDEVFELLDQYVEMIARDEDAASLMPLVKKHLDRCKDCHEEYEALVRIVEAYPELSA